MLLLHQTCLAKGAYYCAAITSCTTEHAVRRTDARLDSKLNLLAGGGLPLQLTLYVLLACATELTVWLIAACWTWLDCVCVGWWEC